MQWYLQCLRELHIDSKLGFMCGNQFQYIQQEKKLNSEISVHEKEPG